MMTVPIQAKERSLFSDNFVFTKNPILWNKNQVGHHVTLKFTDSGVTSSGIDALPDIATLRAISKAHESLFIKDPDTDPIAWMLHRDSSTDCFSAALTREQAIERSNDEAVEKKIRLMINQRLATISLASVRKPSTMENFLNDQFESLNTYHSQVTYTDREGQSKSGHFFLTLGVSLDKIYIGSGFNKNINEARQHSLVKCYKHYITVESHQLGIYEDSVELDNLQYLVTVSQRKQQVLSIIHDRVKQETSHVSLPPIAWQNVCFYHSLYICRSFVYGYLDALKVTGCAF